MRRVLWLTAIALGAGDTALLAASTRTAFVRVRRDFRLRPLALDTAIVTYTGRTAGGEAQSVDLVAAIHIADAVYYRELNRRFEAYDAILYELIAETGARELESRDKNGNPLSALQGGLQSALGLSHQLDNVDYRRPVFVHADFTPDEFSASMSAGGESVAELLVRAIDVSSSSRFAGSGIPSNTQLLSALMAPNRPLELKRLLAPVLQHMDQLIAAIEGDAGTTLIARRNERALSVLAREIKNGKRRVAIFYGAAHLPDLESHLIADFALERGGVTWLTAWDLAEPKSGE